MPTEKDNETIPRPDPTTLTTQQLNAGITGLRDILETRLQGMDKAIDLLHQDNQRLPVFVKDQVDQLRELHAEKFASTNLRFEERDIRSEKQEKASQIGLDAALTAAKELVSEGAKNQAAQFTKSETAVTKQMDGISTLIQTMEKGINDKIDGVKERNATLESRLNIIDGRGSGQSQSWSVIVTVIAVGISVGSIVISLFK